MGQTQIHSKSALSTGKSVSEIIARVISDAANPLLIPPLVIITAGLILGLPPFQLGLISFIALAFFTLIPFGTIMVLLQNGHIQSLDVPFRKNRNRLFGFSIISTTLGSLILFLLCYGDYRFLALTAVVFFLNPVIGYLFNLRFKISIHTAAVASAGILFLALFWHIGGTNIWALGLSLFMLLVLLPLMFWSRRQLGIHTNSELAGGSAAGIFFTLLEIAIMQMIW